MFHEQLRADVDCGKKVDAVPLKLADDGQQHRVVLPVDGGVSEQEVQGSPVGQIPNPAEFLEELGLVELARHDDAIDLVPIEVSDRPAHLADGRFHVVVAGRGEFVERHAVNAGAEHAVAHAARALGELDREPAVAGQQSDRLAGGHRLKPYIETRNGSGRHVVILVGSGTVRTDARSAGNSRCRTDQAAGFTLSSEDAPAEVSAAS